MQLLVLAAAIINAHRPAAPVNKFWDDVLALPQVENGVLFDSRQAVTVSKTVTLGTGRFGGQCMVVAENQLYTYGNTPFILTGDFTFEGHAYFTGNGDNDYIFDTGGNILVLKLVGNQWKVAYGGSATPLIDTAVTPVKNQWYHFAVVRQGQLLKLYVDGVSIGQATFPTLLNQAQFTWGNYTGGGPYSHIGRLDNCRISSIARYTANFTPLMEPFPIGGPEAGFDPYWGQVQLLVKEGSGALPIDATGKGTFTQVGANALISTTQKRFGDNSIKVSGNHHFRMANADGRFNYPTEDFTVECWVHPLAFVAGDVHIIGRDGSASSPGGYKLALNNMRPRMFYSNIGATSWTATTVFTGSELPLNRWSHLAMTRAGNILKLFVNGKLLITQAFGGTMSAGTGLPFTIGATQSSTEGFNGYIDSVRVTKAIRYAESFTPKLLTDVAVRGDAGGESLAGYDTYYSNNVFAAPLDGSFEARRQGVPVNVMPQTGFDQTRLMFGKPTFTCTTGVNSVLSYSHVNPLIPATDFTVESWVNSTYNDVNASFGIVSQFGAGGWGLVLRSGQCRFYYTSTLFIASTTNFADGQWKHIAVTRRNGVITMYVNGVVEATVSYTGSFSLAAATLVGRVAGNPPAAGYRVNLADLRVTNGFSRYNTAFTPPTKAHPVSGLAA